SAQGNGDVAASIRIMVGKEPIFDNEVKLLWRQLKESKPELNTLTEPERKKAEEELLVKAIDQLIDRELVVQEAIRLLSKQGQIALAKLKESAGREFDRQIDRIKKINNMKTDEEFDKILRMKGTSLESWRRQREREFIYREFIGY